MAGAWGVPPWSCLVEPSYLHSLACGAWPGGGEECPVGRPSQVMPFQPHFPFLSLLTARPLCEGRSSNYFLQGIVRDTGAQRGLRWGRPGRASLCSTSKFIISSPENQTDSREGGWAGAKIHSAPIMFSVRHFPCKRFI